MLHFICASFRNCRSSVFDDVFSVFPDPDPPSDRGSALAALLPRRGSLLPPSARGLLPGRSGQTQEDLRLEPEAWQPRPPHR